jgi:hypothetical protein
MNSIAKEKEFDVYQHKKNLDTIQLMREFCQHLGVKTWEEAVANIENKGKQFKKTLAAMEAL